MIELRWGTAYPATGARGIVLGSDGQQTELVLQYRYKKNVEAGATVGFGGMLETWSEWKDVPFGGIVPPPAPQPDQHGKA